MRGELWPIGHNGNPLHSLPQGQDLEEPPLLHFKLKVHRTGEATTFALRSSVADLACDVLAWGRWPVKSWRTELTFDYESLGIKRSLRARRTEKLETIRGFSTVQELLWRESEEGKSVYAPWWIVALVDDGRINILVADSQEEAHYVAGRLNAELVRYRRPHSPYRD